MVDAPEFPFAALNRDRITDPEWIFLTHWHPDHVNSLRVVQSRDATAHKELRGEPRRDQSDDQDDPSGVSADLPRIRTA